MAADFKVNEKVLCFNETFLLDARIIEVEPTDQSKDAKYKVHFIGRPKSLDQWVDRIKIRVANAENNLIKENLKIQYNYNDVKRKKKIKPSKVEKAVEPQNNYTVETDKQYLAKVTFKIDLPKSLSTILVEDWDLVTRQRRFYKVPANVTIAHILDTYKTKKVTENPRNDKVLKEFSKAIQSYFNEMLGSQLLYELEKPQYIEVMEKNATKTLSQIYGVTHLLRLFVKIGSVLAFTSISGDQATKLLRQIHDFLSYIHSNLNLLLNQNEDYLQFQPSSYKIS